MILFFGIGLLAWALVLSNFVVSFYRRRSTVRFVFVAMASGWPVLLLREMHLLPRWAATVFIAVGICGGLASAHILVTRWLNDPRVLE